MLQTAQRERQLWWVSCLSILAPETAGEKQQQQQQQQQQQCNSKQTLLR
jgi:hypothetical protein